MVHLFIHLIKNCVFCSYHVQDTSIEFHWNVHHSGSPKAKGSGETSDGEKLDTRVGEKEVMNRSYVAGGRQVT